MSIEKIIYQLSSIKQNAESFTTEDGDDEVWRADIAVCEELISILSEMQDAGICYAEQAHKMVADFAKRKKKEIRGERGKWR